MVNPSTVWGVLKCDLNPVIRIGDLIVQLCQLFTEAAKMLPTEACKLVLGDFHHDRKAVAHLPPRCGATRSDTRPADRESGLRLARDSQPVGFEPDAFTAGLAARRCVAEHCSIKAIPVHAGSLAAPPEGEPPRAADLGTEATSPVQPRGHRNSSGSSLTAHEAVRPRRWAPVRAFAGDAFP